MKITGVSTTVVDAGDRDWVFVRVDTDEPGLFGWGEACSAGIPGPSAERSKILRRSRR